MGPSALTTALFLLCFFGQIEAKANGLSDVVFCLRHAVPDLMTPNAQVTEDPSPFLTSQDQFSVRHPWLAPPFHGGISTLTFSPV